MIYSHWPECSGSCFCVGHVKWRNLNQIVSICEAWSTTFNGFKIPIYLFTDHIIKYISQGVGSRLFFSSTKREFKTADNSSFCWSEKETVQTHFLLHLSMN